MTKSLQAEPNFAEHVGSGLAIATMTSRLLVPTEATAKGETLWITVLMLVATVVFAIGRWRAGHRPRFDLFSVAIVLLVGGHFLSGLWVLGTEGQKRFAVNTMWEWLSLGATCYVLRGNRSAVRVVIAMCIVLAGYGVWQYFVDFPALRAEWSSAVSATSEMDNALSQRELSLRGIPQTESARRLFADRLASLEPLGPFALTNTLAGFLAIGSLFVAVVLLRRRSIMQSFVAVGMLGVTGYCLVLTKSRTAVAGTIAALVLYAVLTFIRRRAKSTDQPEVEIRTKSRGWLVAAGLASVMLMTVLAAVATGGLDEQVISESPKSLRYRLMYWQGSLAALAESPLFGTGPGNFRQRYTPHKLAASSEEILDPHNMFLDAWCNGGLITLLGLLALIAFVVRSFTNSHGEESTGDQSVGGLWSGLAGVLLVLTYQFLTGQEQPLLSLGLATGFFVAWLAVRFVWSNADSRMVVIATHVAVVGLMIHLLGAGGFEMPAVAQILILFAGGQVQDANLESGRSWFHLAVVPFAIASVVACLATAAIPVTRSTYLIQRGNQRGGDGALQDYAEAQKVDSLSPDAPRLFAQELLTQVERPNELAVAALMEAKKRDPDSFFAHYALGTTLWRSWTFSQDNSELESALSHFQRAVGRYPTNPRVMGDFAILQAEAGQAKAATNAAKALQLDQINRQNGHQDRFLTEAVLNQLKAIVERKK
ncbi:MAG: O-antigen ligase family protein [Planctomycetaceae bacterium]